MQSKTTRAFRTISEAGDELGLQPHVLRFWESKFPDIKPIKRGGGRRFYRPEDIEFLRGIKILLHDEKHPIKDVQKLIRIKGAQSIMKLGQSVEKASNPKNVSETVLIPERIRRASPRKKPIMSAVHVDTEPASGHHTEQGGGLEPEPVVASQPAAPIAPQPISVRPVVDEEGLEDALSRLLSLRTRWQSFLAD